ncbi:unnamed protein product [Tetraodon nigroviridis]|uniref:(spotted green pufferfish) hypothetical protein n=1 Tax=Tetraodon nigroviridis TaxID=99883 RepID=Q4RMU8_TETNG|nr:unnamed protein product [Tetraodon nigroviridis]
MGEGERRNAFDKEAPSLPERYVSPMMMQEHVEEMGTPRLQIWPLADVEDKRLNVGERLRARGAPRSFIFLSNRKKKKENTDVYMKLRPRCSQVTSTGVKGRHQGSGDLEVEVSEDDATGPGLRQLRFHQRGTPKLKENKPKQGGNVGLRELRTTAEGG